MIRKTCLVFALLAALLPLASAQRNRVQDERTRIQERGVEAQDGKAELSEMERILLKAEPAKTIAEIPAPFVAAVRSEYESRPALRRETSFEQYLAGRYLRVMDELRLKAGRQFAPVLPAAPDMCGGGTCDAPLDTNVWGGAWTGQQPSNISDPNLATAQWTQGLFPNTSNGVPSDTDCGAPATQAHHSIVPNGTDPVIPTLKTVAPVPTSNPASLRLGNRCIGYGGERVTKTFTVNAAQTTLQFWYASVFQDPQHDLSIQPGFGAYLLRADGTKITGLIDLDPTQPGAQDFVVSDRNNPFFGFDKAQSVVYTNWNCVTADLSSLVNQTVTLVLVNRDCGAGGHWGYTYVDSFCMGCAGTPTGNATFNPAQSDCARGSVCFNYTVPKTASGATGQVTLSLALYQNGLLVNTLTSGPLVTDGTYCFPNVWANLNQSIGFDWKATANFSLSGSAYQIAPITIGKEGDGFVSGQNNDCAAPSKPVDPCCPPWDKERLKDSMFYAGSGSISAPYTLHFNPSAQLTGQLQAYVNYLHSTNPAITGITIDWSLIDLGVGTNPVISKPASTTWTSSGGPTTTGDANFFSSTTSAYPMQVGTWYRVRAVIHLNRGQSFFPEKCAVVEMDVRIQVIALSRTRPGATAPPAAALEFGDGTTKVIEPAPPARRDN